ncbi:MAG: hypothetical protein U0670_25180, partial [Anaerolineae bacterium]
MAGSPQPIHLDARRKRQGLIAAKRARRSHRVKTAMGALLVGIDAFMLIAAFALGYYARESLPFFQIPNSQPPLIQYIPTMILHAALIMAIFYLSRFYHMRRAISRIDHARNLVGAVTIG